MAQTIDWEARGIVWSEEEVSKQHGPHATDRVVVGIAQIPVVKDLDKFRAEYGDGSILGSLDGTSIRVMAQDVNRTGLAKGLKADALRERVDARIRGTRNRPLATTVVKQIVYMLPDNSQYSGTSLVEYQQAYMAALVDSGVDATVARTIAMGQQPEGLK